MSATELCKAAQLCVFILGTLYLGLGVLRVLNHVFGVRYAVRVFVTQDFELSRNSDYPCSD